MKNNDNRQDQFTARQIPSPEGQTEIARNVYKTEEVTTQASVKEVVQQDQPETPLSEGLQQEVTQENIGSPQSVLTDQVLTQEQGVQQGVNQALPRKKGGLSKKLGIFAIFFVLILAGLFVVYKFQAGKIGKLFGNKGEIVWWGIMEEESVIKPLIDEFQEDNPDIKIVYKRQSSQDYRVRLTNSLAGGKGPDIFEFHNSWVPMYFNELSTIPNQIMSQSEFSQTFYSIIVSDLLTKEGLVGIPLFYDAMTLYINEDLFASVLKQPPTTWNELGDLVNPDTGVLTLTDDRGAIIQSGVAIGKTENIDFWQDLLGVMMSQNGADLKKPTDSQAFDAVSFYLEIGKDVWDESLPQSTAAFAQGAVAMYFGPSRKAYDIAGMNSNLRFRTVPLPQLPKNFPTDLDVTYATYWVQGVWNKSTNKEEAWRFLRFLSERTSLEKINSERKTVRNFELASPRMDMARMYLQDPILSSVVSQATNARSWYLADETYDGETGINSKVAAFYEEVLNSKDKPEEALEEMAPGLARVLSQYGVVRITPTPEKK